ncbi:MAG: hypothetical protein L6R28_02240 [Planctomycetes bacterium]|nr:hypothetical protein [Planctomycetota bacterium]
MRTTIRKILLSFGVLAFLAPACFGAVQDEFRVKREEVFEFVQKPAVAREGDAVTIRFETKGYCDVTVAIEEAGGRIVRHLASGVLGNNAPAPFAKDAKAQTLVWDGKDDAGIYVDNKDAISVRVSLGLVPRLERSLFWSPHKRLTGGKAIDADALRFAPAPEGVYVSDGTGVDSVRLMDHDGNYVRQIYPFPSAGLDRVEGLPRVALPQDGKEHPLGFGMMHATLLDAGSSADKEGKYGFAAQALAVHGDNVAVAFRKLNRLSASGGAAKLAGAELARVVKISKEDMWSSGKDTLACPRSAAFSPDGKTLYLGGYGWTGILGRAHEWLNGIAKIDYAADAPPELFAGSMKQGDYGSSEGQFKWAVSIAVDAKGRVYAADHLNSRIQVFAPEGKFLKAIPVERPAFVGVHHKTGEIYALSWRYGSDDPNLSPRVPKPIYTRFGPLEDPKVRMAIPLKILKGYNNGTSSRMEGGGMEFVAALDSYVEPPVLWLTPGKGEAPLLLVEKDGALAVKRDFAADIRRDVVRAEPPIIQRQRLYVNPADGKLYVGEADSGVMKSFKQLVELDPETNKAKPIDLPFDAEDMCIGLDGLFHLRTDLVVARYQPKTWREVPWDYGEECASVGFGAGDGKRASLMSGLVLPATGRMAWWHMGGMAVSPRGHLVVTCCNPATFSKPGSTTAPAGTPEGDAKRGFQGIVAAQKYKPRLYPGRAVGWETHLWDKYGKLVAEDATQGMDFSDGVNIDNEDNLYFLSNKNRSVDGKPYPVGTAGTLIKLRAGKAKGINFTAAVPVPAEKAATPDRPADFAGGGWAEGVEWMYGGVGLNNMACICWNARPALDLYARSFAPEINHRSVAVLDTAGNLILRVGRYGNIDDGVPLVPEGGPAKPRALGGDEVALVFPAYLATHSDRRLFIADAGNSRIASVKLAYHTEETIKLRDVPDNAK